MHYVYQLVANFVLHFIKQCIEGFIRAWVLKIRLTGVDCKPKEYSGTDTNTIKTIRKMS